MLFIHGKNRTEEDAIRFIYEHLGELIDGEELDSDAHSSNANSPQKAPLVSKYPPLC